MTQAQYDAIEMGGLDEYCLEHHRVCVHCGSCTNCRSGCQCVSPDDSAGCDCGGCEEVNQ